MNSLISTLLDVFNKSESPVHPKRFSSRLTARLNRMRNIIRWPLMRSLVREDVAQHCFETNNICLILAMIDKHVYGKTTDPYKALAISQVHESEEALLTGDINSVVKNATPEFKVAYERIKVATNEEIISDTPEPLQEAMSALISPEWCRERQLAKFADIIQAFIKATEEVIDGNGREFTNAATNLGNKVKKLTEEDQTVAYFHDHFLGAHFVSVDELLVFHIPKEKTKSNVAQSA